MTGNNEQSPKRKFQKSYTVKKKMMMIPPCNGIKKQKKRFTIQPVVFNG